MNTTEKSKYIASIVYTRGVCQESMMIPVRKKYVNSIKLAQIVADAICSPFEHVDASEICIVSVSYYINNMY